MSCVCVTMDGVWIREWIYWPLMHPTRNYRVVYNELAAFTAPRFTATGPPPAVERTRILPMTQHAGNVWNDGKFLITNHRRCWKCCPSTRRHSSQWQKRFWFTFWRFSAGIFEIFPTNVFFWSFFRLRAIAVNFVLQTNPEEKITRITPPHKHSTLVFYYLVCYESRCSKFIHQIMNCLSAGNSFITKFTSKFSPTPSSRSAFHRDVIRKYRLL
jgi:hypothetical protein